MCQKFPLPDYEGAQQSSAFICVLQLWPSSQIPFFSNTDSIWPQPCDNSCLVLQAPWFSTEPSQGCCENLPNWDAQCPGKEEFVGTPTHSSPKPGHRALHTAQCCRSLSKELMQILSYPSWRGVLHTSGMMGETIYRYSVMSTNALYKLFPFYWL